MAETVKLLRQGRFKRRFDSNQHGAVDMYYVSDLLKDSVTDRNQVVSVVLDEIGDENTLKWGLPLSAIEPVRISATRALVQVTWGRLGGNGGYFLPLAYSKAETVETTHNIPIFFFDGNQWQIDWIKVGRPVSRFIWNTRVPNQFNGGVSYGVARAQYQALKGQLFDLSSRGLGLCRLADGSFKRLASNEIRAELVFEQPAAIIGYIGAPGDAAGVLGNEVEIKPLEPGGEYKIKESKGDIGDLPEVKAIAYNELYPTMPDTSFPWMDFSK